MSTSIFTNRHQHSCMCQDCNLSIYDYPHCKSLLEIIFWSFPKPPLFECPPTLFVFCNQNLKRLLAPIHLPPLPCLISCLSLASSRIAKIGRILLKPALYKIFLEIANHPHFVVVKDFTLSSHPIDFLTQSSKCFLNGRHSKKAKGTLIQGKSWIFVHLHSISW